MPHTCLTDAGRLLMEAGALPPTLRRVRERDLDAAIRDLREAVDAYHDEDGFGPDEAGRINFGTMDEMAWTAERVLRLLEELR